MATIPCPHPSPLSESQDWYRQQSEPVKTRSVRGYEIKKGLRHHHAKRSYVAKVIAERRRRIFEEAMALILAEEKTASSIATVAVGNAVAVDHAATPAERTLEQRFLEQAEKWDRETSHMSSPLQKMMHPSYQAILGMSAGSPGNKRDIIRFMLHDLKDNHREWSLALSYLTQYNPINPKDYGKTSKIATAWIRWGEGQGLI